MARGTGEFFLGCLEGTNRASFGKSQIGLAKRVYILVRDNKSNVSRDPVQVFAR